MHRYDHAELEAYLARHVPGFVRLDAIEKFSEGQSNPTYKLTSGGRHYVLRAKPPGNLLKSAHAVDREFRVMKALTETDVPVPEVLHLSGDVSPMGPQFMVMEMVDRLKGDLNLMLYPREFYERPKIGSLAKYLAVEFTSTHDKNQQSSGESTGEQPFAPTNN